MSDGDGRDSSRFLSERENQHWKRKKKKLRDDEFSQAIARIAVAQVCESLGFQSFQQSALDSLADAGVKYIREIGKTASSYANLANRTHCNVFDVIQGLEDLGSVQGFSGASDVNHSLSGSGVVKDIICYIGENDEIPFAYLTPVFPIVKRRTLNPSFEQAGEYPPDEHIPSWLPKFPDPETYSNLSSGNQKDSVAEIVNKIQPIDEEHREVVRSLLNFQHKSICNGFEGGVVEQGDGSKSQRVEENNPFLAPPLEYRENELSFPAPPDKILDDVADYRKSSEALRNNLIISEPSYRSHENSTGGPCEPEDRQNVILNGRPGIRFKFGNGKKIIESSYKVSIWFGDDRDSNDMKERGDDEMLWEDAGFHPE